MNARLGKGGGKKGREKTGYDYLSDVLSGMNSLDDESKIVSNGVNGVLFRG